MAVAAFLFQCHLHSESFLVHADRFHERASKHSRGTFWADRLYHKFRKIAILIFYDREQHNSRTIVPFPQQKVQIVRRPSNAQMTRLYEQHEDFFSNKGRYDTKPHEPLSSTQWENAFEISYLQQFSTASESSSSMSSFGYSSPSISEVIQPTPVFPETVKEEEEFDGSFPDVKGKNSFLSPYNLQLF
jgi:hypothetical protein